jgi:protein involved in polysaccharide export with SLBB domain
MRSCSIRPFVLCLVLALSNVVPILSQPSQVAAQQQVGREIRLHPGDALRLEINDEPGLNKPQLIVGDDGSVLLPLVGLFKVTERPFSAVQVDLRSAYGRELVNPVVRATPLLRIPVIGEVRQPGLFYADPTQTVGDLLATAGGLTATGNRKKIALLRDGHVVIAQIDPSSSIPDISLQSGDQIVVARRGWLGENSPVFIGALASVAVAAVTTLMLRR